MGFLTKGRVKNELVQLDSFFGESRIL